MMTTDQARWRCGDCDTWYPMSMHYCAHPGLDQTYILTYPRRQYPQHLWDETPIFMGLVADMNFCPISAPTRKVAVWKSSTTHVRNVTWSSPYFGSAVAV
jgi:hypothetical protein